VNGDSYARDWFARSYEPVIRAYLNARWRSGPHISNTDDAVQEVFVALFKPDGALERADETLGGFRGFLFGVIRNIARRIESQVVADTADLTGLAADDSGFSQVFDRAWAKALMRAAAQKQAEVATQRGADALQRVELLRLRFQSGMPIRDIALRWGKPAEQVHREYAKARAEFRDALRDVIAFHQPGKPEVLDATVSELLSALS
jgi:RNA polymerase sigma-70 factor (ECF subfamily)